MSVWRAAAPGPALSGLEGVLVSVSIDVDPLYLEDVLEALARVEFPINPQIYHDAEIVYRYADGREEAVAVTLVEFPAYASRLDEVHRAMEAYGFDRECVFVTPMLEDIHADSMPEPAPEGATYQTRCRRKYAKAGSG
ncbi:MAG: hypothetical protein C5B51_26420 [Terriglobia bacterium]|nr:MAG: hypothetical protein C5B51_26420 [Terriglobia bacterium]